MVNKEWSRKSASKTSAPAELGFWWILEILIVKKDMRELQKSAHTYEKEKNTEAT